MSTEVCFICKCEITEKNISRREDQSIRLDSTGHKWCTTCADDFDNIDWSE
jgi:hypothetical protein